MYRQIVGATLQKAKGGLYMYKTMGINSGGLLLEYILCLRFEKAFLGGGEGGLI